MEQDKCAKCGEGFKQSDFNPNSKDMICEACAKQLKKRDALATKLLLIAVFLTAIGLLWIFVGRPLIEQQQASKRIEEVAPALSEMATQLSTDISQIIESAQALAMDLKNTASDGGAVNQAGKQAVILKQQAYNNSHPYVLYSYLGLTTKEMIISPEVELPPDYDPTSRPWYHQALVQTQPELSDPYQDPTTFDWIVTLTVPLFKDEAMQQLIGVSAADIKLNPLITPVIASNEVIQNIQQEAAASDAVQFTIATTKGIAIAHTTEILVGNVLTIPELVEALAKEQSTTLDYTYLGDSYTALIEKVEHSNLMAVVIIKR